MSEKRNPAELNFECRNSAKIIRRDGTVEEIAGEWESVSEEEALKAFGGLPDFDEWLEERRLNGGA